MKQRGIDEEAVHYTLPKLRCKMCRYVWFARKSGKILNCPSCRSTDWNGGIEKEVTIPTIKCPKCSYVWSPRYEGINECPICKQKLKNEGIKKGVKK